MKNYKQWLEKLLTKGESSLEKVSRAAIKFTSQDQNIKLLRKYKNKNSIKLESFGKSLEKAKAPKEDLRGITTSKLNQLSRDNYHNPDTGLEVFPEAAHQEIARRSENKAPKMIASYKRGLKPKKPSGESPEDFFGKAEPTAPQVKINPEHGKIIANAYGAMKHDPNHPQVKAAYNAFIGETKNQFKDLIASGLKISKIQPGQENPYKTSKDLHNDLATNNHMWYFPTEQGFGSEGETPKDHPMLQPAGINHGGHQLLNNDAMRIVHDVNGHFKGGQSSFGPRGEHQAFLTHKKMYSPLAQKALASETLGQSSTVNFGPHAAHNKAHPEKTIYAPQKAGLLPDSIINGEWHK